MKLKLIIFLFLLAGLQAKSQILERSFAAGAFGNYIYFDTQPDSRSALFKGMLQGLYVPDHAVSLVLDKRNTERKLSSPIALGVKLEAKLWYYDMAPVQNFSKSLPAFRLKDNSPAIVIAIGINKNNIADYRYRVVLNDSAEVVHWSPIPKLEQQYGATQPYGFIGSFSYPNKQAMVEVVNIKNYSLRTGAVFDWRKDVKPFVFAVTGQAMQNKPKQSVDFTLNKDSLTQKVAKIFAVEGTVGYLLLHMRQHPGLAYGSSLNKDDNGQTSVNLNGEGEDINGVIKFNVDTLKAGKYDITIYPKAGLLSIPGQETHIELNITSPRRSGSILEKKASFKQLIPYTIGAVLVTALLFVLYRRRANAKLAQAAQAKQNVSLKMRSIRAQLNPHFMFNALTSIQNLVNKKDMEGANHYLSRFADLTRKVLYTSERDLISLEDEVKILDDYLQMEQLRFGFQYKLNVADNVDLANTEVPAMLLQPFVENAVKHGVSNLRENGMVTVSINRKNDDLVFLITDNGHGFNPGNNTKATGSFGLKLSQERIALLNEVYKDQPAKLDIQSGHGGTTVTITLTNWIS
ncbi:MAG: histidine kinase [Bacteroidota bacterium]